MRKLIFLAIIISLRANANLYNCANNEFKVVINGNQIVEPDLNDENIALQLFENDITVSITEKLNNTTNTYSIVAAMTDGAGQDSFQSFIVNSALTPLVMKANFYFEHEGGCLEGSVYSESQKKWVKFDRCWGDSKNRMMCENNL